MSAMKKEAIKESKKPPPAKSKQVWTRDDDGNFRRLDLNNENQKSSKDDAFQDESNEKGKGILTEDELHVPVTEPANLNKRTSGRGKQVLAEEKVAVTGSKPLSKDDMFLGESTKEGKLYSTEHKKSTKKGKLYATEYEISSEESDAPINNQTSGSENESAPPSKWGTKYYRLHSGAGVWPQKNPLRRVDSFRSKKTPSKYHRYHWPSFTEPTTDLGNSPHPLDRNESFLVDEGFGNEPQSQGYYFGISDYPGNSSSSNNKLHRILRFGKSKKPKVKKSNPERTDQANTTQQNPYRRQNSLKDLFQFKDNERTRVYGSAGDEMLNDSDSGDEKKKERRGLSKKLLLQKPWKRKTKSDSVCFECDPNDLLPDPGITPP